MLPTLDSVIPFLGILPNVRTQNAANLYAQGFSPEPYLWDPKLDKEIYV